MRLLCAALIVAAILPAQTPSPYRLRADVGFLSDPLLEERRAGTRGDPLAAAYVRARLAELGFETHVQEVTYGAVRSHNVVGLARGLGSTSENVVFTAHFSRLGGLVALLEAARLWAALEPAPLRSAVFAVLTDEPDLAGTKAYLSVPAAPGDSIRMHLELEAALGGARSKDVILAGGEGSPLWGALAQTIQRFGWEAKSTPVAAPAPEAGNFAAKGIPSFVLRPGEQSAHPGAAADTAGLEQIARLAVELGLSIANLPLR
jgi:acetylornithine deacetylase/succinyl-diaminopimelate desuccinylase-like protein